MKKLFWLLVVPCVAGIFTTTAGAAAQRGGSTPPQGEAADPPQFRVQLVVSKSRPGTAPVSLPFEVLVSGGTMATINIGVDVPIPTGTQIQYRRVGHNIQCEVAKVVNDVVTLAMDFEASSIEDGSTADASGEMRSYGGAPLFRSFRTVSQLTARIGETLDWTVATDRQTNETHRVAVTVSRVR